MQEDTDDVLALAAMADTFEPLSLVSRIADARRDDALAKLARNSTEIEEEDGHHVWRATSSARQHALRDMTRERVEQLLANAPRLDALSSAFRQLAQHGMTAGDANADVRWLYDAVELLRLASAPMSFDLDALSRELRGRLNRNAIDDALGAVLQNPLRGRQNELSLLLDFAAAGGPALRARDQPKTQPRGFKLIHGNARDDISALLVIGVGGVGKSALIAEAIRHLRGNSWQGQVVVHFDFDMPSLKAGQPIALMLELARQIALARPALDTAMAQSRELLRAALVDAEHQTGGAYEKLSASIAGELSRWSGSGIREACGNIVFVLDTLEEVAVLDTSRIDTLFEWLDMVRMIGELPPVRVIAVGRAIGAENDNAPTERHFAAELQLGDLDPLSATTALRDQLEKYAPYLVDRAPECVKRFGGNPLVLKILANYAQDKSAEQFDELLADAEGHKAEEFNGVLAQRYLYTRMLDRVRDLEVKPLAHPGLVLRRVSAELICNVLAQPCGLGRIDQDKAATLLRRLEKQVWLVSPDGSDCVRHRRDVRRLMLPQMLHALTTQEQARDVNQRAALWFDQHASSATRHDPLRLESWYHRALLQESLDDLDATDLLALADHLGEDIADLSASITSRIRHAQGRVLSSHDVDFLGEKDRARAISRRARKLSSEGLDSVIIKGSASGRVRFSTEAAGTQSDISTLPSWQWDAPDARLPGPDDFKAMFAEGEFERVAQLLPALFADFDRRFRIGERSSISDPLDEPIYLSAIAARAVAPKTGFAQLQTLIPPDQGLRRQPQNWKPNFDLLDDLALLSVVLEGNRISTEQRPIVGPLRDAWEKKIVETPGQWRQLLAHALITPGFAEIPAVQLGNLTFLQRDLLLTLISAFPDAAVGFTAPIAPLIAAAERTFESQMHNPWRAITLGANSSSSVRDRRENAAISVSEVSLQDIELFAAAAKDVTVSLHLPTPRQPAAPVRYIGLTPEFYGAARSALWTLKEVEPLRQAIECVAAKNAFWPKELAASSFTESARRSQIPILLRVADYFGAFGELLRCTAENAPSNIALRNVVQVFTSFESAWAF